MAPRQNTFVVVPNPLGMQGLVARAAVTGSSDGNANVSKPPMTSKQAQQLYRKATRRPRMSRAEQRRLEREELERIRKETEKEKQAAKARAAREKKKELEKRALEDKRRKGLPLVEVHPSQDTISRFVRGNGTAGKRDADGRALLPGGPGKGTERLAAPADDGDSSDTEGRSQKEEVHDVAEKRQRTGQQHEAIPDTRSAEQDSVKENIPPTVGKIRQQQITEAAITSSGGSLSTQQQQNTGAAKKSSPLPTVIGSTPPNKQAPTTSKAATATKTTPTVAAEKSQHQEQEPLSARAPLKEVTSQFIKPSIPIYKRTLPPPPFRPGPQHSVFKPGPRSSVSTAAGPPTLPPAFKPATGETVIASSLTEKPRYLRSAVQTAVPKLLAPPPQQQQQQPPGPPTSTQLFVASHFDDLFPSPSQEARELQAEKTQAEKAQAQAQAQVQSVPAKPPAQFMKPPAAPRSAPRFAKPRAYAGNSTPGNAKRVENIDDTVLSVFSTQDFVLSSQDMRDLETPSKPVDNDGNVECRLPSKKGLSGGLSARPTRPVTRPKPSLGQRSQSSGPARESQDSTDASTPQGSPLPSGKRFFTSSGVQERIYLAMEESKKTHRQEERDRELEQRRRDDRRKQERTPTKEDCVGLALQLAQAVEQEEEEEEEEEEEDAGDRDGKGHPAMSQESNYGDWEDIDVLFGLAGYAG